MFEHALGSQRLQLRNQLLRRQRDPRATVFKGMAQLFREQHRIYGYHDRISAQDGIKADDELWAILHMQKHPVASGNAAHLLQIARQRIDFFLQLTIADFTTIKNQRCFIRISTSRNVEVHIDAGFWRVELMRQSCRPMSIVSGIHSGAHS